MKIPSLCDHAGSVPRILIKSNGSKGVRIQCTACGWMTSIDISQSKFQMENLDLIDDDLLSAGRKNQRDYESGQREQRKEAHGGNGYLGRNEWFEKYDEYLNSIEWRELRELVFSRDSYTCQSCLSSPAEQVHHLSYEMYNKNGHSMAFELISICESCHKEIHPHMNEDNSIDPVADLLAEAGI